MDALGLSYFAIWKGKTKKARQEERGRGVTDEQLFAGSENTHLCRPARGVRDVNGCALSYRCIWEEQSASASLLA